MQEIVCNRASSVGIPTALDAEKVREINDLLLDNMGRYRYAGVNQTLQSFWQIGNLYNQCLHFGAHFK